LDEWNAEAHAVPTSTQTFRLLEDRVMKVVFGANGKAGGETARVLIEDGVPVRVVVRRSEHGDVWKARGAEVAIADLYDIDQVSRALQGATGAFLLSPPPLAGDPYAQAERLGEVLAEAFRRADLEKAVVLSSIGAQHASGTGVVATLHAIETALAGIVYATDFLRCGYFLETWSEVAEAAVSEGILPSFLDLDQKIPMVSTTDVGRAAARLLTDERDGPRTIELSGPTDWSARDVAAAFADVLGRPVEPVLIPPDLRHEALADAGIGPEVASALLDMYEAIANGRIVREQDNEHWRGSTSLHAAVERIVATQPLTV
jgi:uncharacterized protein YbjT (DUF2867 family)